MLSPVLAKLRCPICRLRLEVAQHSLRCPNRHTFDRARHGYVDLTAGRITHDGDSAEMVAARAALHAAGHLDFVSDAIAAALPATADGLVVDVGAGTGHHLARVLDAHPNRTGLAVDVARPALRRAARGHPRMAAVRADVWRGLPLADGGAAVLLNVFAPRNGPEFRRILRADGVLVVVTPEPDHLVELVEALDLLRVDPGKPDRLAVSLEPEFRRGAATRHAVPLKLSYVDATALVAMGPSAHHLDPTRYTERLRALTEPIAVTAAVSVGLWYPGGRPDTPA